MTFRNLFLVGCFIIGIALIGGCAQNKQDNSFAVCETFTIYQETDINLLPVDTIEKAMTIKDKLPKCPNNQSQPGCIVLNKEYVIEKLNYSAYSIRRVDNYGVPMTIHSNGTVTWTRCAY